MYSVNRTECIRSLDASNISFFFFYLLLGHENITCVSELKSVLIAHLKNNASKISYCNTVKQDYIPQLPAGSTAGPEPFSVLLEGSLLAEEALLDLLRNPLTAQCVRTHRPSPSPSSRQLPKVISAQEQTVGLAHLPSQFLLPTPLRVMILRGVQNRLSATNPEVTSSYQDIQSVLACQRVLDLYKRNLFNSS